MKKIFFVAYIVTILFSSCLNKENELPEPDACATVSFMKDVQPVINEHCAIAGCHVTGFLPGDFTTYEALKQKIDSGLFQLMVFELEIMPPADSLNDNELKTIQCWIENGAMNN